MENYENKLKQAIAESLEEKIFKPIADMPEHEFSEEFEEKMQKLFDTHSKLNK